MKLLQLIAFLLFISGGFVLFSITPKAFITDIERLIKRKHKKVTFRQLIDGATRKKNNRLILLINETQLILKLMGKKNLFITICIMSVLMAISGIFLALLIGNFFLIPILTIGMAVVPFWYIKTLENSWRKSINEELETALSIITNSYMRSDSVIAAIEENIEYINPPVREVFQVFLIKTRLINANIRLALTELKDMIDSDVFKEWIDALISCQHDKNLKSTLSGIVTKLSDMRVVSGELNQILVEPVKEFIIMSLLFLSSIPLLYVINKNWYHALLHTVVGQATLAIAIGTLFFCIGRVISLRKPVEYRR